MTEIPSWFGTEEFYAIIYLLWGYLFCWVITAIIRTNKLIPDFIKRILNWLKKRKKDEMSEMKKYGFEK